MDIPCHFKLTNHDNLTYVLFLCVQALYICSTVLLFALLRLSFTTRSQFYTRMDFPTKSTHLKHLFYQYS